MGSAGVHHLQVIACVLDCQCGVCQLPRRLGMWEQMHPEFLFLGLQCCHPSTQRWSCTLLCYCKTAHDIETGAFWVCLVMVNILEVTSEINLLTGLCLGCCSAILCSAKHSHSRREIPTLGGKTINDIGLFWICLCFMLMPTGRHSTHTNSTSVVKTGLSWCTWERGAH